MEIRDRRKTEWFWSDKSVLKAKIKTSVKLTYFALCIHANEETQVAFPGIDTLAQIAGTSRRSVIRALAILDGVKIIRIDRQIGRHNTYTLLPVTSAKLALLYQCHGSYYTSANSDTKPVPPGTLEHTKEHTNLTRDLIKEIRKTHSFLRK